MNQIDDFVGKPVDTSALYETYGFIGIVQATAHNAMHIKGFVQRKRCSNDFWDRLESRKDKTVLKSEDGEEAILLDCVLDIGGYSLLRIYDGYDKDTDYFLSKVKDIFPDAIAVKAIILQSVETDKPEILVQDKSKLKDFNNMVREMGI
ncbi:MAG: hypothetical protein JW994_03040 [Candidatus Omnitrophica bacterium]|nr:hypothetical protein [Candidatus Omnitrophota bacterium]